MHLTVLESSVGHDHVYVLWVAVVQNLWWFLFPVMRSPTIEGTCGQFGMKKCVNSISFHMFKNINKEVQPLLCTERVLCVGIAIAKSL